MILYIMWSIVKEQWYYDNVHCHRINDWKNKQKMKLHDGDDWISVYLWFITTEECEHCGVQLTMGRNADSRSLDHDHETGYIRNVLCRSCNSKRVHQDKLDQES